MTQYVGKLDSRVYYDVVPSGLVVHDITHSWDSLSPITPARTIQEPIRDGAQGIESEGNPVMYGRLFDAALDVSVGDNLIYHRVWVLPLLIEAGFITEETEHDIKIWNADYNNDATITGVVAILPDGTTFSLDSFPVVMGVDAEYIYIMTVEQKGPPVQDTYYTITIDGVEYTIYVTGTRVIIIDREPEWRMPPEMKYSFQTVIAISTTYDEQRRSLTNSMIRESVVKFVLQNSAASQFAHKLMYGHDKVFGIPIFSEISILDSGVSTGDMTLDLVSSCVDHWNLNNIATHILIVNYEDEVAEIKELDTVDPTQIVLTRALVEDFSAGSTIYPCFFASLQGISSTGITDNLARIDTQFREYFIGSKG